MKSNAKRRSNRREPTKSRKTRPVRVCYHGWRTAAPTKPIKRRGGCIVYTYAAFDARGRPVAQGESPVAVTAKPPRRKKRNRVAGGGGK